MPQPTREQITTAYWALPQEIRNFLYAEENVLRIEQIGKKFALNDDQTSKLAKLAGEVIMGVIHLDAFAGEIRQRLNVDMIKAYDIAKEVSLSIFSNITPWMEKVHGPSQISPAETLEGKPEPTIPKPPVTKPEIPPARPLQETKEAVYQKPPPLVTSDQRQETSAADTYREPVPPEDLPIAEEKPSPNIVDLRNP